jgi:DNA-binding response OmpR family regulator
VDPSNAIAQKSRRIVLIDDDPAFCSIMASFATSRGLCLDYYSNLQEMGFLGKLSSYSVAIVDFDLGTMSGIEIAEYLPIFFGDMPMVLVSGMHRDERGRLWPKSVKEFVHKDEGPDAILDAAVTYMPRTYGTQILKPATGAAS